MDDPIQQQIQDLQQAIEAQESLRSTLGDSIVDQTIAALREKLTALQPSFDQERKLVTCLFCDVVDSTRLARNRDPEEVLGIIDGALQEMIAGVEAFDGYAARFMGDGMLALFGAPQALEHHAEQAMRAGLEIQLKMASYSAQMEEEFGLADFAVRVGINTGYVVGGHVAGGKGEYTVIGDAINIANRLEAAAPPGSVLVGQSTFRLANGQLHFDYESWPAIKVKGSDVPLDAYRILAVRERPARIGPAAVSRASLVGRQEELALLQNRLLAVNESREPSAITIVGAAGAGKSRLAVEFRNWLFSAHPTARMWVGRSLSYEQHTPYWLAGDLLRYAVDIRETDKAEKRRQKLSDSWSDAGNLTTQTLHGLGAILALTYPDDMLAKLEPEAKRKVINAAFADYCTSQANRGLLVMVFEDIHWADEQSLELIDELMNSVSNVPLLILNLERPAAEGQIRSRRLLSSLSNAQDSEIVLAELSPELTMAMIQALLGSADLPTWLMKTIAERSQGNPFFVEEIVNDLIEAGSLRPVNGSWQVAEEKSALHVPDTVQGVLAARIDRLDPALKHTIQYAAMIGRTFWQRLLAELVGADVADRLERLSELGFVHRFGEAAFMADWEWSFRHVLVQEVAYDSVLKEARRPVHAQIGRWLEKEGAERIGALAPALARHFLEGQVWEKAIVYLAAAGARSRNLFALSEAERFYDQALALMEAQPGAVVEAERLWLLESRGTVRGLAGDFEGAVADLDLVLGAARSSGDGVKERDILIGQGMVYRRADDYESAASRLSLALDAARESGDQRSLADALFHLGSVAWSQGENLEATSYYQQALEICRREGLQDLVAVQAIHGRAEAYFIAGQLDTAIKLFSESLTLARQIGDKSYEAENLQMIAMSNDWGGIADYEVCLENAQEALKIARSAHLDWHSSSSLYTLAAAYLGKGEFQTALDYNRGAQELALAIGAIRFLSFQIGFEGQIYLQLNWPEKAEELFHQALRAGREANTYIWLPRLKVGLAVARLRQGDHQVGPLLEEALAAARLWGQGLHISHCFEGLAELAMVQGANGEAEQHAKSMLELAQQNGQREREAVGYRLRGEARMGAVAAANKPAEAALQDLEQAHHLAQEIGAPHLLWKSHGSLAKVYQLLGDRAQAEGHAAARRETIERVADNLQDDELVQGLMA